VGQVVLISGIILVAVLLFWHVAFTQYNRRKGSMALRWVEVACADEGRIVDLRWLNNSRLKAQLRFSHHPIGDASVTVRLRPRPMPLQWVVSLWRKQQETLTFEADLDHVPTFNLEVMRHRWFTENSPAHNETGAHRWTVSRPGPVVLTTRTHWNQELTPVVNTLMTSRGHSLLSVRFRSKSPHLSATVALQDLSDQQSGVGFLEVVRELAAGASAPQ
jgi:hypothetical protein